MPNTRIDPGHLAILLQLGDGALPTGAFSHSFGLESYLAAGTVTDEAGVESWLRGYLETQLCTTDALAMRMAATGEMPVAETDALLDAAVVPSQVHKASLTMGSQLAKLVPSALPEAGPGPWPRHYCLVFVLAAVRCGVPLGLALHAYLAGAVSSLVQNAVRAVPLGQTAGQRILGRLRPLITESAEYALHRPVEDFGSTAPGLEIAQMRHEHLRARMFMS
ncbi:urease accessory protein UreF [Citricoccus muralis]|uniref:Urease accessory protein UreF n=1 Tax=Citricoccus muralis TaxID=169134 RepID=A0A3D9LD91_9MICC|nr:urease accessory protein UreF [Citricoccus muralis]REE04195.1 urease accessory protein [Citricoccus muralis]